MSGFMRERREDPEASEIRRHLSPVQRERMLAILIRNEDAFARAVEKLAPEQFPPSDRAYSVVWAAVVEYWQRFKSLPSRDDLVTECRARIEQNPGELLPAEIKLIQDFIRKAWKAPASNLLPQVGLSYLQRWLEELLFESCRAKMSEAQPRDAFRFLQTFSDRAANLTALTDPGIAQPFDQGWDTDGRVTTPLGIGPIDYFLGGGYAPGEVYVLLGPVGSCKTLTAVQISTNIADIHRLRHLDNGGRGPIGVSYLFYYEGGEDEIRQRAITYRARIDKDVVCAGNLRKNLRKAGEPRREYELVEFALQIQENSPPDSEYDRFENAIRELNVNWRAIAMKPHPTSPGRGGGLYMEVLQLIEDDLARQRDAGRDVFCAGVVVDYLGIMVERHIQMQSLVRDQNYRPLLVRSPLFFKNSVAEKFHCPVFLMHQLNAKGNSLSPTQLPKLTDSEGSNMLAENADFGIVIGKPQEDRMCRIGCEKSRHAAPREPVIFQINGKMGYIAMPREAKVIDPNSRRMVGIEQLHKISKPKGTGRVSRLAAMYDD